MTEKETIARHEREALKKAGWKYSVEGWYSHKANLYALTRAEATIAKDHIPQKINRKKRP